MFIFMLTAIPLTFFLFYSIYEKWRDDKKYLIEDLGWGVKVFIVSLIIILITRYFVKTGWNTKELFIYHTVIDYALWAFICMAGYIILYGFEYKNFQIKFMEISGYLFGYYIFSGIIDTLVLFGNYNVYTLFMLPMFRVSLILFSALIISLAGNMNFRVQILAALGCVVLSCLGGVAAMLFYIRNIAGAWIITAICLAGSAILTLFMTRPEKSTKKELNSISILS